MWNDPHQSVRKVAGQTLGRTSKGKQVHAEIYRRLSSDNLFDRLQALDKLNFIGILTPSMLEVYLKCFRDNCIAARELAIKVSQNLLRPDERVIDALVYMVKFERVTKLKASAIRSIIYI